MCALVETSENKVSVHDLLCYIHMTPKQILPHMLREPRSNGTSSPIFCFCIPRQGEIIVDLRGIEKEMTLQSDYW